MANQEDLLSGSSGGAAGGGFAPHPSYLNTYTAGEDNSRLAEMAKQFGLEKYQMRKPRQQVRARTAERNGNIWSVQKLIQNQSSTEFARMRAVYSSPRGRLSRIASGTADTSLRDTADAGGLSTRSGDGGDADTFMDEIDIHAHDIGSDLKSAVIGIVKGMVGPAILYLPHAIANAGYAVAFPIMAVSTLMFLYSAQCLLDCWSMERQRYMMEATATATTSSPASEPPTTMTLSALMEQPLLDTEQPQEKQDKKISTPTVVLSYPELAYSALGTRGESFVKLGIALMQSGVCLTYLIFVPTNLSDVWHTLTGITIPPTYLVLVMWILQIPLSWIRDIRKLTWTNLLANGLILYGLLTCLALAFDSFVNASESSVADETDDNIGVAKLVSRLSEMNAYNSSWVLFIGTSVLLFEGSITLLVPLQEAVDGEEQKAKFPSMYRTVICCIITFYAFFGMICWISFGDDINTVLTVSLPPGVTASTVQLAYSLAVIFTFPLQNFPSLEIATRSMNDDEDGSSICSMLPKWIRQRNVISAAVVTVLCIIAVVTMDNLDKVVSLTGSLMGLPIAFVIPPMIHSQLHAKYADSSVDTFHVPRLSWLRKGLNWTVGSLGFVAAVLASIITIVNW